MYELSVEKYEGFLKVCLPCTVSRRHRPEHLLTRPMHKPRQALYADTLVYGLNAYFTKVALLLVIARVFNSFRKTRIITFLLVGAMAFYYAPMLFLKMNVCRPISGFWTPLASMEPGAPAPVCLNQRAMFVADTIISAITDTAVLIIPIPATVSLRMPWQRRLKVWSMLGLGGVATAASIVRLVIVFTSIQESEDQTVDFVRFNLLGFVLRFRLPVSHTHTHTRTHIHIHILLPCLVCIACAVN